MRVMIAGAHGADPSFGGAERYVRDLAIGLGEREHEVSVLSSFPPRGDAGVSTEVLHRSDWRDDQLRRLRNHGGDVIAAPWPRLGRVLDAARPDLLHTNNLPGMTTGIWEAARRRRIPVIHTLHDYYLLCPRTTLLRRDGGPCAPSPLLCGLRTRRLSRWQAGVGRVIAGSEFLLRRHAAVFDDTPRRVIRLPMTLDGAPPDRPRSLGRIGFLGALTRPKGVELLLDATAPLAERGVELEMAGDGPLRERVAASSASFAGRVEGIEKHRFLGRCDIGVVPSLWDEPSGPPYVVLEWLAAGRPVLVTRRGGLDEAAAMPGVGTFEESTAGLLAAIDDLAAGEAWPQLLDSVPRVVDDRDRERWLDEHEDVYRGLVSSRGGGAA